MPTWNECQYGENQGLFAITLSHHWIKSWKLVEGKGVRCTLSLCILLSFALFWFVRLWGRDVLIHHIFAPFNSISHWVLGQRCWMLTFAPPSPLSHTLPTLTPWPPPFAPTSPTKAHLIISTIQSRDTLHDVGCNKVNEMHSSLLDCGSLSALLTTVWTYNSYHFLMDLESQARKSPSRRCNFNHGNHAYLNRSFLEGTSVGHRSSPPHTWQTYIHTSGSKLDITCLSFLRCSRLL